VYRATNLNGTHDPLVEKNSPQMWLSAKGCSYPQEVIVSFPERVRLSQIQLLSHESFISQRVDIMVVDVPVSSKTGNAETLPFNKLGHLTLDKNEKTNFSSRELKSVYIDATITFLKLVFHSPYLNDQNTFSQVGVINLKCFGSAVGEDGTRISPRGTDTAKSFVQSLKSYMVSNEQPLIPQTALPPPEPLPDYFERDYPQLAESLSLPIAAHICSRDWRLREKGVAMLMEQQSTNLIPAYLWTMKRLVNDKIVNVYIRVAELIQLIVAKPPKTQTSELSDTLDLIILHMIDNRLCDFNKRIAETTVVTLVSIAKDLDKKTFPVASLVVQYALKPFDGASRVIGGRCTLISALINSIGLKAKRNESGVPLEPLVPLIATWLNKGGDIRVSAMHVLNSILSVTDLPKFESAVITSNLPETLQQVLMFEASRVGGNTRSSFSIERISECEFCTKSDPAWSDQANMDLHYWDECPLLIECRFCEQIVEITGLTEHRLKECENEADCGL